MARPEPDDIDEVCRRLGPALFRRCLKILRDPDRAADACQGVFVQLVKHRHALPPKAEQLRWAYVVATRVCLTHIRNDAWESSVEPSTLQSETAGVGGGLDEFVDRALARKALSHADEHERVAAWLVLVDGHTQQEAAELLGLSRKTIGRRLQSFLEGARRRLNKGRVR
jgi:RNA polymerase sigma-70 factor, ECF subfamily